jgi:hypothetical protein
MQSPPARGWEQHVVSQGSRRELSSGGDFNLAATTDVMGRGLDRGTR